MTNLKAIIKLQRKGTLLGLRVVRDAGDLFRIESCGSTLAVLSIDAAFVWLDGFSHGKENCDCL